MYISSLLFYYFINIRHIDFKTFTGIFKHFLIHELCADKVRRSLVHQQDYLLGLIITFPYL